MMMRLYAALGRIGYPILLPLMRPLLNRTSRAYVIIECQGQVLLVKNWLARDEWRLPGGGLGRHEQPKAAVTREIKEELRIVIDLSRLEYLGECKPSHDGLAFTQHIFRYSCDAQPRILPERLEIIDTMWSDNPKEILPPELAQFVH